MTTPSNFLKELQAVYVCEDYRGDITNPPLYINGVKAPTRSKTSYEGLPGNQPGQGNPTMIGTSVEQAEEQPMISKELIRNKINDLMQNAQDRGMDFATEALYDLLQFIEKV